MQIRTLPRRRFGSTGRAANVAFRLPAVVTFGLIGAMGPALAQQGSEGAAVAAATLPRDLSPWGMFMQADIVVKAVMAGLAFATLVTCTVCLSKAIEMFAARRNVRRALRELEVARSLDEAVQTVREGPVARLLEGTVAELDLSTDRMDKDGIKARIASRLQQIEAAAGRRIAFGTGVLATIGATGPFVGLFGTVWGIMNSFIGISKSQTTNLAVVAPGIAEALLATALGLVAAIPAVVIYNLFARQIGAYRALLVDSSSEIARLAGRDLDGGTISAKRLRLAAAE